MKSNNLQNGKKYFYLVIGFFVLWIFISSYWYVCGVKNFCGENLAANSDRSNYKSNKTENDNFLSKEYKKENNYNNLNYKLNNNSNQKKIVCYSYITNNLDIGSEKKDDIKKLQIFLNQFENEELAIDGLYGPLTFKAVSKFQIKNTRDLSDIENINFGVLDEKTRDIINKKVCLENILKKQNDKK